MSPSRIFIERPVATSLFMLAIVLSGLLGFLFLPLSALPQVDFPTIQIQTLYPGASPEVMSQTVTAPLERQLGQMPGLQRMSSTSASGVSIVTLQFGLGLRLDVAEQEVQAAINASGSLLPADLPAPPVYAKVNPADAPIMTIAVTSDNFALRDVQNFVNSHLALKLSQVTGVGLVTLSGGQRPAIRIQVDNQALATMGLGLDNIRTAITAANANGAKGSFNGATRSFTINANDQLVSAEDYQNLIVTYKNGAPIRLKDVAHAVESAENVKLGAWSGLTPAIILNIQREPGANVIETVNAIKARLPQLKSALPDGINLTILSDRTVGIKSSVDHVEFELLLAVMLVVLVIFAFLHSLRATIIACIAVPISLVGAFGVMYLLDYSINNLSLMALTIATGFVVDDAIVMMENISRYVEEGESPMHAALKGSKQIGFTIISLTVSLIAVLIPLLFMSDVVGRLFREFAVTLSITILISALVSLTLVPMMTARLLKKQTTESNFHDKFQKIFDSTLAWYDEKLQWVLQHQRQTLWLALGTLVLTVMLYVFIPKNLFPTQDTGQLQARVEADASVSFDRMAQIQKNVSATILEDEAIESLSSIVGVDAANNTMQNTAGLIINLKPNAFRNQEKIMARLRHSVDAQVPGVKLYLQPIQDLTIDAEVGPTQYRVALTGSNNDEVVNGAQNLANYLNGLKQIRNAMSDAGSHTNAVFVEIDRDAASRLGVTASSIDDALYSAFGQRIVSTIFTDTNQYRVILEAQSHALDNPEKLANLPLKISGGKFTYLSAIAKIQIKSAPSQITRVAQYPGATIGFDTAPGVSLGQAVDAIKQATKDLQMPETLTLTFLGASGAYQASQSNELWLILAALVCVYIVLGVLYESYIHPLTILSTLPSAGLGALLALWLSGIGLGVIGIIGIILLIGIVKKNAIMMIDFALDAQRNENKSPRDAIYQAALLRFRPILMTTLAALFAAIPLMLGWGDGAELRRPLGFAIFGGLVVSQLLTLFTTPVIYLGFEKLVQQWNRYCQQKGWADSNYLSEQNENKFSDTDTNAKIKNSHRGIE